MNLFDTYSTSKDLEKEGVFLQYGTNSREQPIRFQVARAGGNNKAYDKALERKTRPHKRAIANSTLDERQADALLLDVFIETVLLGWSGVEDSDNNEIVYDRKNARQLMQDLPDLYADLRDQAGTYAIFRKQDEESIIKNSGKSLSTD